MSIQGLVEQARASCELELGKRLERSDPILAVGEAPLELMQHDPDSAVSLAHSMLHAHRFSDVPLCWRRCYEEAQLWGVARSCLTASHPAVGAHLSDTETAELCLTSFVRRLDLALTLTGAPMRYALIQELLALLQRASSYVVFGTAAGLHFTPASPSAGPGQALSVLGSGGRSSGRVQSRDFRRDLPPSLSPRTGVQHHFPLSARQGPELVRHVRRLAQPSLLDFQLHWRQANCPAVLTDTLQHWDALTRWKDPAYWIQTTIGGRRLVPVEIGSSYTDDDWGQTMMTFRQYLEDHLLPGSCRGSDRGNQPKGYLAQHDLLRQIPSLHRDIGIPDYCWVEEPLEHTTKTAPSPSSCDVDESFVSASRIHVPLQRVQDRTGSVSEDRAGACGAHVLPGSTEDAEPDTHVAAGRISSSSSSSSSAASASSFASPVTNIWLGPEGTVSPAHTDPHHNILAQVFGRKYVRLFPPNQGHRLYPMGGGKGATMHLEREDAPRASYGTCDDMLTRAGDGDKRKREPSSPGETEDVPRHESPPRPSKRRTSHHSVDKSEVDQVGPADMDVFAELRDARHDNTEAAGNDATQSAINMSNTSSVDVGLSIDWPPPALTTDSDADSFAAQQQQRKQRRAEHARRFPLFEQAEYVETTLGPGDCLFIPRGWWHYITALDVSCSVSFWWD